MNLKVLAARIARFLLAVAYLPFRLLPRRQKIVVISRQSDQPTQDLSLLIAALRARNPEVQVVVLTRRLRGGIPGGLRYIAHMFRQMWNVATARVVVLDSYCIVVSALNHSEGLTVIQLWHALGALKKFGYSSLDIPGGRSSSVAKTMRMHAGYDVVLVSAEAARESFAEAFRTPVQRVQVAPLPRVDALRDLSLQATKRAGIIAKFPELAGENVVLYAPTLDRAKDSSGASEPVSLADLAEQLRAGGFVPVIKPHPLENTPLPRDQERYREVSTGDLLSVAGAFVTDYSSAVFEAGIAGIPVYFVIPSVAGDAMSRVEGVTPGSGPQLYVDLHAELPECVAGSAAELVGLLREGRAGAAVASARFVDRYVEVNPKESATDKVTDVILEALKQPSR